jgi:hypothetical protein
MCTIKVKLPEPKCKLGYTYSQLYDILGSERLSKFNHWMRGQTQGVCDGKSDHGLCDGEAHGGVVYDCDLRNFLQGGRVID